MTPKITRLDAAALAKVFDRVTVDALLNMARIVGPDANGPTIPEIGGQNQEIFVIIGSLRDQIDAATDQVDSIQLYPPEVERDLSRYESPLIAPRLEQPTPQQTLLTEVRQLAEAVAQIREHLTTEVRQIADRVAEIEDHFTTEIRHVADQQIANANLIHEIRQGTML